ncbi:MAG: hypothetical protein QOE53_1601 [Pseudonocardiales bacterium]|nr:hypothetical protein [Pseudonocardiales bacterium]
MVDSSAQCRAVPQRPISRFGLLDDSPRQVATLAGLDPAALRKQVGGRLSAATKLADQLRVAAEPVIGSALASSVPAVRERLLRTLIHPADRRLAILDVTPVNGPVMSDRPFDLRVVFAAAALVPPRLVSVRVDWAGESFVNELRLDAAAAQAGQVDVHFDEEQTLPVGAATFTVTLFNAAGSASTFVTTSGVLPSNPFSMLLGPHQDFVTGSWSARAVRHGDAYDTGIAVTLFNGNPTAVPVRSDFHWAFWDGGVGGGSLVEQGTGSFGGPISVPAAASWGGWVTFHSPSGSGIFNKFNSREDLAVEIRMTRVDGGQVSATITARTMFRFGVNITRVANEDFTATERSDLTAAAQRCRAIYERRDLTFDFDTRWIAQHDVGGYEIINSFGEFHDLLSDWSGPGSNNNIDAFVVQGIDVGGGVDGIDGSIPGPTSHGGGDSGVIASKTGYIDSTGARRLHANYLGMLIGHELGHYLGLEHVSTAGDLMLPNSGENDINLDYGQYRTMIRHGWVRIS